MLTNFASDCFYDKPTFINVFRGVMWYDHEIANFDDQLITK